MINIEEELGPYPSKDDYKNLVKLLSKEREELVSRLGEAADILADAGRIHNTPHSKRQWIEAGVRTT